MRSEASRALQACVGVSLPAWSDVPAKAARTCLQSTWQVPVPEGSLFYPCCGRDTEHALAMFGDCVTRLHFADPIAPPWSPRVREPRPVITMLPHVGNVAVVAGSPRRPSRIARGKAVSHRQDGLLALIGLPDPLAVFYYRGDSGGEGGSDQRWLAPVLLDVVLGSLLDGGLIYTDGSNGGVPRSSDWPSGDSDFAPALPAEGQVGEAFVYRNRLVACVGHVEKGRVKTETLWRVTRLNGESERGQGPARAEESGVTTPARRATRRSCGGGWP